MSDRKPRPALFLDRDGVINVDYGYVHRVEQFEFVPGIFDLARFVVRELDWPIIVVTNQAGIGRGYFDEKAFDVLTSWMCGRFVAEGAPLTRIYHCPYHPEHGLGEYRIDHPWRKPRPGMILQAACDFNLDISGSVLIGDRPSDILCASAAGIGFSIIVDPDQRQPVVAGTRCVRDLREAIVLLRDCSLRI